MDVKDEFHQKAILLCIEELTNVCKKSDRSHSLLSKSFSDEHFILPGVNLKRCEKCEKFIRTIPNHRDCVGFQGMFNLVILKLENPL